MENRQFGTVSAETPLYLDFKGSYSPELPAEIRQPPPKTQHFTAYHGLSIHLPTVVINIIVPPLVFTYISTLLSSVVHFKFPRFVWLFALVALIPAGLAYLSMRAAMKAELTTRWYKLSIALFLLAFVSAATFSETNYWYFSYPFYFIESMKTYSDIDPSEIDGVRLMDAGKVHFQASARLATDMGMSFSTGWDVFCVAPITTAAGLPSQGSTLATYDIWAVGENCCTPGDGDPAFHCGEYDRLHANSGLRQVGAEQRRFFRLAVQQAEAAYHILAPHPVFFYWVQDPHREESLFFENAFKNWIMANCVHFVCNACAVLAFGLSYHKPPKDDGLPKL